MQGSFYTTGVADYLATLPDVDGEPAGASGLALMGLCALLAGRRLRTQVLRSRARENSDR